MIDIDPNHLEATVAAVKFALRHFVPERQSILQTYLAADIADVNFSSALWSAKTEDGLTVLQARVRPLYIQKGAISALRDEIWKQGERAIDEFNRVCRYRCELVDVRLFVDLGDGRLVLMPKNAPIAAPSC
ncbi:hypothetical protein [Novosphingobium arvoryzae]|uniref:Uncharacterized protein n=1 Tax=Novosphingobium arvoryzae TaxID=1256514 RepID=A0A918R9N7_9SPHN|nr:hypothetical protein [Novosphingobium arvoryzae]GGZ90521.1 hypothetical protein GCM10011617_06830 [Novosphingobium arvoryzae]